MSTKKIGKEVEKYLRSVLEKNWSKNTDDVDIECIQSELLLFIIWGSKITVKEMEFSSKYIIVTLGKESDETQTFEVEIRGDNLITVKNMDRRIKGKRKSDGSNGEDIFSYSFFPFKTANDSINMKRASCAEYNDNVFVFFETLKRMYELGFENNGQLDKVEWCICEQKEFWKMFGTGEAGYKAYLKAFCLNGIEELRKEYPIFFEKRVYTKEWREKNADNLEQISEDYKCLLNKFYEKRRKEMNARLKEKGIDARIWYNLGEKAEVLDLGLR